MSDKRTSGGGETARDSLESRVVEMEVLFTHLQRTLGELDQVVLRQQKQIEALERTAKNLGESLGQLSAGPPEERKPEDEKPPHY
jgi:SlyX protein